ncbi:hypothetical protein MMC30_004873 [Trapelia coarctata]|nr:hypothetical protein [Trapelia coarctata]
MYNMNRLVALAFLPALWTARVQGYAIDPADPTITAAPEHNLLLQERQNSYVTCSDWPIVGGGFPLCAASSTCLVQDTSLGFAGCFYSSATSFPYTTSCFNYPNPLAAPAPGELYCSAASPSCGYIQFESGFSTWFKPGCSTYHYTLTAVFAPSTTSGGAATSTTPYYYSYTSSYSYTYSTSTSTSDLPSMSTDPAPSPEPSSSTNAAVIGGAVGGAVGGIAFIAGAILLFFFIRRRNRRTAQAQGFGTGVGTAVEQPPPEYKSPRNLEPPAEYKAPATDVKPTTYVSEHC